MITKEKGASCPLFLRDHGFPLEAAATGTALAGLAAPDGLPGRQAISQVPNARTSTWSRPQTAPAASAWDLPCLQQTAPTSQATAQARPSGATRWWSGNLRPVH